jgi:NitT/TauT family transport system ATP-binding protein
MRPDTLPPQPALRLHALRFAYPTGGEAVRGVSLDIAPGSVHCLVGRSGCGKTSVLKLAAGLLLPQHGQVLCHGEPVNGPRADMGFVFQRPTLLEWLSVMDNVLLPVSLQGQVRSSDRDQAAHLLKRMGSGAQGQHNPLALSGGQQSRVALARALMGEPKMLCMDEPFAALDAITREELQHDLLGLCAQQGTSVLFVTHDMAEAVYLGDQVSVMQQGQMVHTLRIDLPRPRAHGVRHSAEFNAVCAQLRQHMDEGL